MSAPAHYHCPTHGRVAVRTAGRAQPTALCPHCGSMIERAARERCDVSVATDVYERMLAYGRTIRKSVHAVLIEAIRGIGGVQ